MSEAAIESAQPWYRSLSKSQWNVLIASNLGWLFDGYETFALIITVGIALRSLLDPSQYAQIPFYAGIVIALTLLGWGVGGIIGGMIADYLGRKRTMLIAILAYSLLTGVSAFSWDWISFAVLRFLVGVAIGSEWVTGASIVAELWPDKNRGKGVGLMQCGFGIGFFLASLAWLFISPLGLGAWRYMFLLGVLPGLLTLWVRRSIPESDKWEHANDQRVAALERQRTGVALSDSEREMARFTMAALFTDPEVRRRVILGFLMSLATTFAFWGISAWIPPFMATTAGKAGLAPQQWASYAGLAYNGASIIGYAGFGFLADAYGRKPVTIVYVLLAWLSVPILFLWTHDLGWMLVGAALCGIFVSGQYTWMAAWLPEFFPTRIRATAAAFVFNVPRLIAWIGPLISGWIIANAGGFSQAALWISSIYIVSLAAMLFLPETKGKPLPE
jgi:MFS family permease